MWPSAQLHCYLQGLWPFSAARDTVARGWNIQAVESSRRNVGQWRNVLETENRNLVPSFPSTLPRLSLPLSSSPSQFPTSSPTPLLPSCCKVSSFAPLLQVGLQPTESSNCGLKLQNKFCPFKAAGPGSWQKKAGCHNHSLIAFCACFLLLLLNSMI